MVQIRGERKRDGIIANSSIDGVMELGGVPILIEWKLVGALVVVGLAVAAMKADAKAGVVRVLAMEELEMGMVFLFEF